VKRRELVEAGSGFVKFDEDFGSAWSGDQEEVDAGAVGAGANVGIDGSDGEFVVQDLRGPAHVRTADFNLLNAFAKFLKELRDRAATGGVFRG